MSRLIDADKLVERFPVGDPVSTAKIRWEIEHEPTVDAVQVVRCKDCKWAYDKIGYNFVCYFDGTSTSSDWFCAKGEKR